MQSRNLHPIRVLVVSIIGAVVFLLALDGGAFSLPTRSVLGIAVWWSILLAAALGVVPARPLPWPVLAIGGLLAGFAIWTGLSMGWAPSAEKAFLELDRVLLYLGVFLVAAGLGVSGQGRLVSGGCCLGIVGVATIALLSRFAPDLVSPGPLGETVGAARSRLSFPVDYWNGLAMLVGLSVPLLLSFGVTARNVAARSLAVAPLPAIAAVSYLASSRGGFVVSFVGLGLFVALTDHRWSAAIAGGLGTAGAAGAIFMLRDRPALVDTPLTAAGRAEAGAAALLLLCICILTGLAYGLVRAVPLRRRPPPAVGWGTLAAAVAVVAAVAVWANPVERFEDFKRIPADTPTTLEGHLLSASGSGRWQHWEVAVDQFRNEPLRGGGAGSYGAWWLQHRPYVGFATEAHSLYLEVLGELGLVGLALLAGALGVGFATGAVSAVRAAGEARQSVAGATAAAGAFLVGAAVDWMWELTIVTVVAMACLGVVAALHPSRGARVAPAGRRLTLAVAAAAAIVAQAIALLSHAALRESELAVSRGDIGAAITAADAASRVAPWAASPYVQLALVSETADQIPTAQRYLSEALRRDTADWRLWLVASRLHVKRGNVESAQAALGRARKLNPSSPLLAPSR